jgi:hypothetical protein
MLEAGLEEPLENMLEAGLEEPLENMLEAGLEELLLHEGDALVSFDIGEDLLTLELVVLVAVCTQERNLLLNIAKRNRIRIQSRIPLGQADPNLDPVEVNNKT